MARLAPISSTGAHSALSSWLGTALLACSLSISVQARGDDAKSAGADAAKPSDTPPSAPANDKQSAAKELFGEGRKLLAAGKYPEACAKFEESLRINVGIGTQFNLADCYEHLGKTQSAHALFLGVAASAHAANQAEREQLARERATALEPRLSHLIIDVSEPVEGLVVRRNHLPLTRDAWGADSVVDPGSYLIEASAPGKTTWSLSVDVPALPSAPVEIKVPKLAAATSSAKSPPASPESTPAPVPTPHSEPAPVGPAKRSPRRTAFALSLAGAGAAGVVAGVWLGLDSSAQNDRALQICPTSMACTARQISVHDHKVENAKMFRTWSIVGFSAGGAALAAAAYLFFGPVPRAKPVERALTFVPLVTPDGTFGAGAEGRF